MIDSCEIYSFLSLKNDAQYSQYIFLLSSSDAEFPFNEERVIPDGVNRDSAIIGGRPRTCESDCCNEQQDCQ